MVGVKCASIFLLAASALASSRFNHRQRQSKIFDEYEDELSELEAEIDDESFQPSEPHCPEKFLKRCFCSHIQDPKDRKKLINVVNCTNAGFTDAGFLKHVPENTHVLLASGNTIHELPSNVFGLTQPHQNLREIDLSNNHIRKLGGQTFHHVANVETLVLNFNQISQGSLRRTRLFSNFRNLKSLHLTSAIAPNPNLIELLEEVLLNSNLTTLTKLHLEQNHIERIQNPRMFCVLPSLMDLHLGQNSLGELRLDVDDPDCLPKLRYVDMSYNQVTTVSNTSGIYAIVRRQNERGEPTQVRLQNNPFQCDCHLKTFVEYVKNQSRLNPDILPNGKMLRCATPPSNAKKLMYHLDVDDELTCHPLKTTNEVIDGFSSFIIFLLIAAPLVAFLVFYVRQRGCFCPNFLQGAAPLLTSNPTGVKYTSVDKEEVAEVAHV